MTGCLLCCFHCTLLNRSGGELGDQRNIEKEHHHTAPGDLADRKWEKCLVNGSGKERTHFANVRTAVQLSSESNNSVDAYLIVLGSLFLIAGSRPVMLPLRA